MFTGEYAHQHKFHNHRQQLDPSPLLDSLREEGYKSYGVSGNGFVAHMTGFDQPFDEFQFTADKYQLCPDGISVDQLLTQYERVNGESTRLKRYQSLAKGIVKHEYPLQSLVNTGSALADKVFGRFDAFQSFHPLFTPNNSYSYDTEDNTIRIETILERESSTTNPFFLFANYMDTHRPYFPPEKWQEEYLGRTLSYRRILELNQTVAHPWDYVKKTLSDDIDESELETIRQLYGATVRSVDEQLAHLLDALEEYGLRENTIVVVAGDHGDNLGEVDRMGRNRMGHTMSMSDNLLRVPLVVAHPKIDPEKVSELFSLKDLYNLFVEGKKGLLEGASVDVGSFTRDQVVESQYPALGDEATLSEEHPEIPEEMRKQRSTYHEVAGYTDGMKLVLSSAGTRDAWRDGGEISVDEVPENLVEVCEEHLRALVEGSKNDGSLTADEKEQLHALGYL
jgi:arylsulfatase A-like enzyme